MYMYMYMYMYIYIYIYIYIRIHIYIYRRILCHHRLRVSPWQPRQTEELLVHVTLVDE